jgi:uncharacterized protein YdaU (DUF1376 family)
MPSDSPHLVARGDITSPAPLPTRNTKAAPAFQFYANDYLADPRVLSMTWEQRGVYTSLLCLCWNNHGELPADLVVLARILKISAKKFEKNIWPALAPCFEISGDCYTHPDLTSQRVKHDAFRRKQAANGAKGGRPPKGLGFSGETQTEAKKSSSYFILQTDTTVPVVSSQKDAATHEERSTDSGSDAAVSGSDLAAWLAPIRAVFVEHGARWYTTVAPELLALHKRGIPAARVARGARVMLATAGLNNPGPRMLGAEWDRWDVTARAAELWDIYKREGLANAIGIDIGAAIARIVARGDAPGSEVCLRELTAVRPWAIERLGFDAEGNIREVAKRLAALKTAT